VCVCAGSFLWDTEKPIGGDDMMFMIEIFAKIVDLWDMGWPQLL
jgi:hypothetical protein